jgi:hypothetical protein
MDSPTKSPVVPGWLSDRASPNFAASRHTTDAAAVEMQERLTRHTYLF